jgi:membrane-associated phospholipid phosphatase
MEASVAAVASGVFFVYCAAVAAAQEPRRRNRVLLGCAAGGVCVWAYTLVTPWQVAHDWVAPPLVLLVAYWTSGALFSAPSALWESRLMGIDRALHVRQWAAQAPRVLAEFLEIAYVGVYPVIPIALAIHLVFAPNPDADRFWTVVLVTDFVCFAMLPWIQTRPPRALEQGPPWPARFRSVNMRLLGRASIGVNTFPSGHAAEALAAALLVLGAPALVVGLMFFFAAAIAAGAVFGRYHYAADAVAGYAVALLVWGMV